MKHVSLVKNVTLLLLLSACMLSCDRIRRRKNTYELLILQNLEREEGNFRVRNTKITAIAVEYDENRVLQQLYCDNLRYVDNDFYVAGENILRDGLHKHKNSLKDPHDRFTLKMDLNRFSYRDYDADLSRGDNYMFSSKRLNPSRTLDDVPLSKLPEHSIILVEADYAAKIGDGITIPRASRLITAKKSHRQYRPALLKHVIVYDRTRQLIVAAEHRDRYSNELLSKYELVKVIKLTRKEFYEFWTGP